MTTSVDFSKKSLILITGASKGIGRTIAIEISRHLAQDSVIVLLARSEVGLKETKLQIQEIDKSLSVLTYIIDLSKPDIEEYNSIFKNILSSIDQNDIHFGIIFHNAGHVGTLKQTTDLIDLDLWRKYYDLNMFSVILLNSVFKNNLQSVVPQLMIVNITSLCGRSPFVNMAMYGSAKAARDLIFKVLSLEEPNIIVLSYSPGPVDTDMFESIIEDAQSEEVKQNFKAMRETGILTPVQTVNKMLSIIEKGDFKSGDTVDYFDKPDLV